MRVGLDSFTIWELKLEPIAALDFVKENGLAGIQFGGLRGLSDDLDTRRLREVKAYADSLGLYTHVSVPTCNPDIVQGSAADHFEASKREIETAAACGWHELHSSLGGPENRCGHAVPWQKQLEHSADWLRRLAPVLRGCAGRINLETHGDVTTFELLRLVEEVGPDVAGICLDTANVLCFAEDPVAAARRAAPYTHLTHTKDAIIFFTDAGYRRQVRPPGQGVLDWERILPILAEHAPDLPLSIEDHKWFFDVPIFETSWHSQQPDLSREELAAVVGLAWQCRRRISSGELPEPEEYEAIPMAQQLMERLTAGRDYLAAMLDRLGLLTD